MELLNKNKEWFLSEEGEKYFFALSSLEKRTMFFYSYLKSAIKECFEEDNTLFKIAFFFADALYVSDKKYSKYPFILNAQTNPFLLYLENSEKFYGNEITYMIFMAIAQEKVNPANLSEWIYNEAFLSDKFLKEKLLDKEISYLPLSTVHMVNPEKYKTNETDRFMQLEIAWMFLK